MGRKLLTSLALTGALTFSTSLAMSTMTFAQSETKEDSKRAAKKVKQAGKDAADAAKDAGEAAKDAGKAAGKATKQAAKTVKKGVTPDTTTAYCKDGTVQKGKTKTTACFDHGGVK